MKYRVQYTIRSKQDIDSIFDFIKRDSPEHALKWLNGLAESIEKLQDTPERCPISPEGRIYKCEIRQLLYGKEHGIYRVLFAIKRKTISIIHVRHGARRYIGS